MELAPSDGQNEHQNIIIIIVIIAFLFLKLINRSARRSLQYLDQNPGRVQSPYRFHSRAHIGLAGFKQCQRLGQILRIAMLLKSRSNHQNIENLFLDECFYFRRHHCSECDSVDIWRVRIRFFGSDGQE